MKRDQIINDLITKHNYTSYLEIGLDDGKNFSKINIEYKVSVDPANGQYNYANPTHKMTSDDFFSTNENTFDIIFIDGLHHSEQVFKDIMNSLEVLNPNGTVVCHDMNPLEEGQQIVPRQQSVWTGDCWLAWMDVRHGVDNLDMFVVDTDWGVGVIQKKEGIPTIYIKEEINFKNLEKNRKEWLNLITINEFKDKIHASS